MIELWEDLKALIMNGDGLFDLGLMNDWPTDGIERNIYNRCHKYNHKRWSRAIRNCYAEEGCEVCGYKYQVDTSDKEKMDGTHQLRRIRQTRRP